MPIGSYAQAPVGVVATDGDGPIFQQTVAGAVILPHGTGFRYRAPSGATGVRSVTLKEKRNSGGLFTVAVRTTHAWPAGLANDQASTLVTLNVGGQCFRGAATRVR